MTAPVLPAPGPLDLAELLRRVAEAPLPSPPSSTAAGGIRALPAPNPWTAGFSPPPATSAAASSRLGGILARSEEIGRPGGRWHH